MNDTSPEKYISGLLCQYLDEEVAGVCFDSLEGIEHDDLPAIRMALARFVLEPRTLDRIMREYESWLFHQRISADP